MGWADYGYKRLRELVGRHGEKASLARAAGVDPAQVSRWATGEHMPSADQLEAICRHLHVSADLFLGLDAVPQGDDEIAQRLEVTLRQTQAYAKLLMERGRK